MILSSQEEINAVNWLKIIDEPIYIHVHNAVVDRIQCSESVYASGHLTVSGFTHVAHTLKVERDFDTDGDLYAGTLLVDGLFTSSGKVQTERDFIAGDNVEVESTILVGGSIKAEAILTQDSIFVGNRIDVKGYLDVQGSIEAKGIEAASISCEGSIKAHRYIHTSSSIYATGNVESLLGITAGAYIFAGGTLSASKIFAGVWPEWNYGSHIMCEKLLEGEVMSGHLIEKSKDD